MRMVGQRVAAAVGMVLVTLAIPLSPALAAECDESGEGVGDYIAIGIECSAPPSQSTEPASDGNDEQRFDEYEWIIVCTSPGGPSDPGAQLDCEAARQCPATDERLWRLWGHVPSEGWLPLYSRCFGRSSPPTGVVPTVTAGMVLEAIRRIGLPAVEVQTQPADKTLVNFETIFYTQPQTFTRSLTLFGQQVDVEARPVEYRWHHGDGTVATTTSPGAPYPAKDITYSYSDAHVTVDTRVDVTYAARFRVNGGAWQDIGETVTITGPVNALRIAEAVPVLSGDYS